MKVRDIMTKNITTFSHNANAKEALKTLEEMQISGLPVVDDENKVVGVFTEKEALAAILPSYITKVGSFVYKDVPKAVRQKIADFGNMKVKDIMRREFVTVDEDATLYESAHIMLTQKIRRVPVVNKEKTVVGIISRGDVVKALFEEYK